MVRVETTPVSSFYSPCILHSPTPYSLSPFPPLLITSSSCSFLPSVSLTFLHSSGFHTLSSSLCLFSVPFTHLSSLNPSPPPLHISSYPLPLTSPPPSLLFPLILSHPLPPHSLTSPLPSHLLASPHLPCFYFPAGTEYKWQWKLSNGPPSGTTMEGSTEPTLILKHVR